MPFVSSKHRWLELGSPLAERSRTTQAMAALLASAHFFLSWFLAALCSDAFVKEMRHAYKLG